MNLPQNKNKNKMGQRKNWDPNNFISSVLKLWKMIIQWIFKCKDIYKKKKHLVFAKKK